VALRRAHSRRWRRHDEIGGEPRHRQRTASSFDGRKVTNASRRPAPGILVLCFGFHRFLLIHLRSLIRDHDVSLPCHENPEARIRARRRKDVTAAYAPPQDRLVVTTGAGDC
jgi:hypothetical protein